MFLFEKNLQFWLDEADYRPLANNQCRALRVTKHTLEFPYDIDGKCYLWRVTGQNLFILENRILEGNFRTFQKGTPFPKDEIEIWQVDHSTADHGNKYFQTTDFLAPVTSPISPWLFCMETLTDRWYFQRDHLAAFGKKVNGIDHLVQFQGEHSFTYKPIVGTHPGDYDTSRHIAEDNFDADKSNQFCSVVYAPDDTGIRLTTDDYFPPNHTRIRVLNMKYHHASLANQSEWRIIFPTGFVAQKPSLKKGPYIPI